MPTKPAPFPHVMTRFTVTLDLPVSTELPAAETKRRLRAMAQTLGDALEPLWRALVLTAATDARYPVPVSRPDPERGVEQGVVSRSSIACEFLDGMTQAELEAYAADVIAGADPSDKASKARADAEHAKRQAASKTEAEAMLLKVFGNPGSNRAPPSDMPPDATRH